jgi:hypothetical protein
MVDATGQPYVYTGDDPVNGTDPLGLWSLNPVSDVEQAAGDVHHDADDVGHFLKDPNRWRAEADYAAGVGNAIVSTVTLGHVHISAPYCGYGLASDVGGVIGTGLTLVLGGAVGEGLKVVRGAETLEEAEATVQAADATGATETSSDAGGDESALTPAVIGEGMASRVLPFAQANGYEVYAGVANPENYTSEELLADNRAQVETWMNEGRPIIDVGPNPANPYYPMETSENYAMEHNIVRGYQNYTAHVLDGESDWGAASGY